MGCVPSSSSSEASSKDLPKKNLKAVLHNGTSYKKQRNRLHVDPTIRVTNVDMDGAGRPSRVSISDLATPRPKTGEEGAFEMNEDGEVGDGRLGLTSEANVMTMLKGLNGGLFEDVDFPATASSLFYSRRSDQELSQFTWKRPYELAERPSIYVDGTSRKDVVQGVLGDCWLLSTCAAIAKREDLLHRVVPPNQPLKGPGYTGLVKVRVWRYGHWVTVYIDDRLPQRNGAYCYAR